MHKGLIYFILAAALLAGCQKTALEPVETGEIQACDAQTDCTDPSEDQDFDFDEITMDEVIEKFQNQEDFVVYFGFEACPWCQEAVPVLEEEALKADTRIYFVRTRDENRELLYSDEQKAEITPYISDYMEENDEGVLTLYVPLVLNVKDGTVINGHLATVDGHDAHERQMTDEEVQTLHGIYEQLLNA